jgi:hypothetical protein
MVAALLLVTCCGCMSALASEQGRASVSATEVARGADIGSTVELWVSPTGSDSASGTSPSAPFLTVQRAAAAIAALTRPLQLGGVKVHVAPGVYELNGTLELGPEHSGSSTEAPVVFVADTTETGDPVLILRGILASHSHHHNQTHLLLCCMPTPREQATLCHPFQPCTRIPCCVRCNANSTRPVRNAVPIQMKASQQHISVHFLSTHLRMLICSPTCTYAHTRARTHSIADAARARLLGGRVVSSHADVLASGALQDHRRWRHHSALPPTVRVVDLHAAGVHDFGKQTPRGGCCNPSGASGCPDSGPLTVAVGGVPLHRARLCALHHLFCCCVRTAALLCRLVALFRLPRVVFVSRCSSHVMTRGERDRCMHWHLLYRLQLEHMNCSNTKYRYTNLALSNRWPNLIPAADAGNSTRLTWAITAETSAKDPGLSFTHRHHHRRNCHHHRPPPPTAPLSPPPPSLLLPLAPPPLPPLPLSGHHHHHHHFHCFQPLTPPPLLPPPPPPTHTTTTTRSQQHIVQVRCNCTIWRVERLE